MQHKAIVYSIEGCAFCIKAKDLLESNNIKYEEYNCDDINNYLELVDLLGGKSKFTFPQIFLNKQHVGGYSELSEQLNEINDH